MTRNWNPIDPERLVTVTCSRIKAKCSSCQCSILGIGGITFCKYQRQCQYAPMWWWKNIRFCSCLVCVVFGVIWHYFLYFLSTATISSHHHLNFLFIPWRNMLNLAFWCIIFHFQGFLMNLLENPCLPVL